MTIIISGIGKRLNDVEIYDNLHIEAKRDKITAIFGPNGAGKTTLLNIIAGISRADRGTVSIIKNKVENELKTKIEKKGNVGYMFQNYREALLPWKNCQENLAFPLKIKGDTEQEIAQQTKAIILPFPLQKYPYELSGGQQQMLAMQQTLITKPSVLLLDEPFSSLDYESALQQRNILQEYYLQNNATIMIITHNIEEAVYLSHQIFVLSKKPSRVIGIVNNLLPFPRTLETMKDPLFHKTVREALDLFAEAMKT